MELAPSSDGSGHLSLWVTDYGRDQYPDGRVLEVMLNEMAPSYMLPAGTSSATSSSATTSALALQGSAAQAGEAAQPATLAHHGVSNLHGGGASHQSLIFGLESDHFMGMPHSDLL